MNLVVSVGFIVLTILAYISNCLKHVGGHEMGRDLTILSMHDVMKWIDICPLMHLPMMPSVSY